MRQVIGYLDNTFDSDFLTRNNVSPNELIGSTLQLCFARVSIEEKLIDENPDDIIERLLNANIETLVEYNEEKHTAKIIFKNKIPENVFIKYYGKDKEIIYE